MALFSELRQRRLIQIVVSYAAAGWIVVSVGDQLVDRGVLPDVFYLVLLVLYLGGLAASVVLGWYHGEKGRQQFSRAEVILLAVIVVATVPAVYITITRQARTVTADAFASRIPPTTIAVLPFEDLSAGMDNADLASGLTNALIDQLAQVRALDVISRNGVDRYDDSGLQMDSIARAVGAGTFVQGSIDERGGELRISVNLRESETGSIVQRASLARPVGEVLALRDELCEEVSRQLRDWLGQEIALRRRQADAETDAGWLLVQRAQQAVEEAQDLAGSGDALESWGTLNHADSLLTQAREVEEDWVAPDVLGLTIAYWRARLNAGEPAEALEWIESGVQSASNLLGQNPRLAAAYEMRGTMIYLRWLLVIDDDDTFRENLLSSAHADLDRATEIEPGRATAWSTLSHLMNNTNDINGAVLAARRAYEEDAYLRIADAILRRLYLGSYDLGQFTQAKRWCVEGLERFPDDPDFVDCQLWMLLTDVEDPDIERAWQLRSRLLELTPVDDRPYQESVTAIVAGGVIAKAGLPDSADAVLQRARAGSDVDPTQELVGYEAAIRSITGDTANAMALLRQYVAGNPEHSFEVAGGIHWWWRNLLDHPDFRAVTRRN